MSNFFFPIETTARELDQRIILSVLLAKRNRKIIVGEQQFIRNLSFVVKDGVFFGKHLFGKHKFSDQSYYNRLKRNNFSLVYLSEEGAIWPGEKEDWDNILTFNEKPSLLDKDDYLLQWGDYQKEFYENLEEHNTNIISTGHPRFDLYKDKYSSYFDDEKNAIIKKYGNFILVNTSTSWPNNGGGGNTFTFKKTAFYDANNKKDRTFRFGKWVTQTRDISNIVELINAISLELPEKKIIIRPHPSENSQTYRDIFQNIDNIEVVYGGSPSSWILASDVLIHASSTTAIEAALAKKLIINYKPFGTNRYDVQIPCLLGYACNSSDEAIVLIKKYAGKDMDYDFTTLPAFAKNMFKNFTHNAMDKILSILNEADEKINKNTLPVSYLKLKLMSYFNGLYHLFKRIYMMITNQRGNYKDFNKRFEMFEESNLVDKINAAQKVTGKEVKFTYINKYLFTIESMT